MNKIAFLNDGLRRTFARGKVVMTAGVAAMSEEELTISDFDTGGSEPARHDLKHAETAAPRIMKPAIGNKGSLDLRPRAEESRAKLKDIDGAWTTAQQ